MTKSSCSTSGGWRTSRFSSNPSDRWCACRHRTRPVRVRYASALGSRRAQSNARRRAAPLTVRRRPSRLSPRRPFAHSRRPRVRIDVVVVVPDRLAFELAHAPITSPRNPGMSESSLSASSAGRGAARPWRGLRVRDGSPPRGEARIEAKASETARASKSRLGRTSAAPAVPEDAPRRHAPRRDPRPARRRNCRRGPGRRPIRRRRHGRRRGHRRRFPSRRRPRTIPRAAAPSPPQSRSPPKHPQSRCPSPPQSRSPPSIPEPLTPEPAPEPLAASPSGHRRPRDVRATVRPSRPLFVFALRPDAVDSWRSSPPSPCSRRWRPRLPSPAPRAVAIRRFADVRRGTRPGVVRVKTHAIARVAQDSPTLRARGGRGFAEPAAKPHAPRMMRTCRPSKPLTWTSGEGRRAWLVRRR